MELLEQPKRPDGAEKRLQLGITDPDGRGWTRRDAITSLPPLIESGPYELISVPVSAGASKPSSGLRQQQQQHRGGGSLRWEL